MQKFGECSNEEEVTKLDEYFKETLTRARPHVLALTSTESAQLCKIWLNKLNIATSQRRLRNEYLTELCGQLKTGQLRGIFSRPPPNGLLLPLPKSCLTISISSSMSDISDHPMRSYHTCHKASARYLQNHQRSRSYLRQRSMDTASMRHGFRLSPRHRIHDHKLQTQSKHLRDQLSECHKSHHQMMNRDMDDHVISSISRLNTEVSVLKAKLTEVQKLKNSMEDGYKEAVEDYHFSVVEQLTTLKDKLDKTYLKNEALENKVATISKRLEEIAHGKDEESKQLEQKCMDKINSACERIDSFMEEKKRELQLKQDLFERKDVESSQKDAGIKTEIELLTNKVHDLETKLEMKIKDENTLQTMIVEQYATMKEELNKMKGEIDETQKQNQNLVSQVSALRRSVAKVEKSKEKLEYDYEKKLSHVIKNKDVEIKTLQLRLKEQENELSTSLSTKKQTEVDNIASMLEKRYKMLLAQTEAMSESQTQEYLRKIANLEDQVLSMKRI